MSFVAIPGLVGPLIGPTLGGWLTQVASWHWMFLINVPVGVAGAVATRLYMPQVRVENLARFDWSGYALLTVGMIAVSLALDGLGELGLRQATVLVLLIGGFAGIVAYWLHASRHPDPLFAPALFGVPSFRRRPARQPVRAHRHRRDAVPDSAGAAGEPRLFAARGGHDDAAGVGGEHGDEALRHGAGRSATATGAC